MKRIALLVAAAVVPALSLSTAHAQSAPTCSFNAGSATLTVNVNGQAAALSVAARAIRLNGTQCGAATVNNTNTIEVNGGPLADVVTVSGTYAPGLSPEADGNSEIEMTFALAGGKDIVKVNGSKNDDLLMFSQGGIDPGNDGDQDVTFNTVEVIRVYGKDGNDIIDASAYGWGAVFLYGGNGDDTLIGSAANDSLYGDAGIDVLHGGPGNDKLWGGINDDLYFGELGDDTMNAESTVDGADEYYGGAGIDTVSYATRTTFGVTVTIGNGVDDDGGLGENDNIDLDVENVDGTATDDNLTGSPSANVIDGLGGDDVIKGGDGEDTLAGSDGADTIIGGPGDDSLYGLADDDDLSGGIGNDYLSGGNGDDILDGQAGNDTLQGDDDNDTVTGGSGTDQLNGGNGDDTLYNLDANSELLLCGEGLDSYQSSPLDTPLACENAF